MTEKKTYNSKWINIRGKAKWAKVYEPDEAFGASNYKINIYPSDEKEWKKFNNAGIQKKVREDEDGKFFTVSRPTIKLFKSKPVTFCPPKISVKEGTKYPTVVTYRNKETGEEVKQYDPKDEDKIERDGDPVLIGNGSEVIVNICVYNTIKGPGTRLEGITILDLITYEPSDDNEPDEESEDLEEVFDEVEEETKAPW